MKNYIAVILISVGLVNTAIAEDTEIFIDSPSGRAQVLIVFDTSGSMGWDTEPEPDPYDPSITYPQQGAIQGDRIYWSTTNDYPGSNSDNWMEAANNNCNDSQSPLEITGKYLGNLVQYKEWTETVWVRTGRGRWRSSWDQVEVDRKEWVALNDGDHSSYFECQQDFTNGDPLNPGTSYPDGYPVNDVSGGNTTDINESNVAWQGPYTLFTGNYLNWYHNPDLVEEARPRIDVAKEVISSLVLENTSIDFGLNVFNESGNGGRIVKKIEVMDNAARNDFVGTNINSLIASGSTPLCESTYEAYLYLTGLGLRWGDDMSSPRPPRDLSAESGGVYLSPELTCGDQLYIILMTDGVPTSDTGANELIRDLTGKGCDRYPSGSDDTENCLPQLAEYMANLGGTSGYTGTPVKTYTIGFNLDEDQILFDTAKLGGGQAYSANTANELTQAFEGVFLDILASTSRFTAPTIATNAFSRVRSIDDAYIAAFIPSSTPRWSGNLKKLHIGENTILMDKHGQAAIDPGTGQIRDTATTFWSNEVDGSSVELGGAGGLLRSGSIAERTLYTNTSESGGLEVFNESNTRLTEATFAAADEDEFNNILRWTMGWDVLDEDGDGEVNEARPWILGDILHSKPLAINYGAINGHSNEEPDIRLIFGTNAGFLHMIASDTGEEDWAFFPTETADISKVLYYNNSLNSHPYGVDGQVSLFLEDTNFDGSITAGEKAIIMFGQRRGGETYYTMDVTDPDSPILLWSLSSAASDFVELGESWSQPQMARIAGHENPVAIFGAGYDENKDLTDNDGNPLIGSEDRVGRGVFIVDLLTGAIIHSFTPASNNSRNTSVAIEDSIPAPVKTLDSDGDGFVDRIYAADTGGNIWRIDMPGNAIPADGGNWSAYKFAELGGDTVAEDRRFHNQPDVLQTIYQGTNYDAVVIGSGDRPHPNEQGVENKFFMLKDMAIRSSCHGNSTECSTAIPNPIVLSDLYDASANLIQTSNGDAQQAEVAQLTSAAGWYFDLEGAGEKNLGKASTAGGMVVFTTYTPGVESLEECSIAAGLQLVYAVNLHDATAMIWGEDAGGRSKTLLGSGIFGEAGTYYGEQGITQIIGLLQEDHIDTNFSLQSYRTHWYEELDQH